MQELKKDSYLADSSSLFGSTNLDDSSIKTGLQLDQSKTVKQNVANGTIRFLTIVLLCIIVPVALYFTLRRDHFNVYVALHLSGLVPVMAILHRIIFDRTVDIMGVFIFAEFVSSMVVLLLPGDEMEIMTRKAWLAIGNAIVFLLSMIPSRHLRPLLYYAFRDVMRVIRHFVPSDGSSPADRIAWAWSNLECYRNTIRSLTIMWMLIYLVTGSVRLGLIYKSNLPQAELLNIVTLLSELPLGVALLVTILVGGVGMRLLVSKRLSEHNIVRNTSDA